MRLRPSVVEFLAGEEIIVLAATASLDGVPSCTFGALPRIESDDTLTFVLSSSGFPRVLDDLTVNPRIALSATRISDYVSYQIKGRVRSIETLSDAEVADCTAYLAALAELLWRWNPLARESGSGPKYVLDRRLRLEVTDLFVQTPGPAAGSRVSP